MCPRPRTAAAGACRAHGIGEKTGLLYRKNGVFRMKKLALCLTCLAMVLSVLAPLAARGAEAENKVVKVGWYESAFHRTDKFGRRSGYGYEFQQRVAIYTGWTFEYVEGSWSELFEMLEAGEIDLLSDVSYTDERAEKILYSAEEMGSEDYHVFIAPENTEISPDDFSTLNGKRVGVNKNSVQEQMFIEWAESHHIHPQIEELTGKTPELLDMLARGDIDVLVTLDAYGKNADVIPVCNVGASDFYFGVNKNRPDLKDALDMAMNRIQEDNRSFNQQLAEKYENSQGINGFLTPEETEWVSDHGAIRVGYQRDHLPFCAEDAATHALTGALADYLEFAETCEKNAQLSFETQAYDTVEAAMRALADGEMDCLFPINMSAYDGEQQGVIITDSLVSTEVYAAVRTADHRGVLRDESMTVAALRGHPSFETFLMDYFPAWNMSYYDDASQAFQAVASGEADCVLVSSYRLNRIGDLCARYKLSTLATGEMMNMAFAVRREDDCLYSILNKVNRLIPDATVNASLTNYAFSGDRVTFGEFLRDNLAVVMATVAAVAFIIMLLLLWSIRAESRASRERQLISAVELDGLTKLYNRNFFFEYANRIHQRSPEPEMDAVVVNIEQFHSVNELNGREFGDRILELLGAEIRAFLSETEGIGGRFEADNFEIYCKPQPNYAALLDRLQGRLGEHARNASIRLRMGVTPWQAGVEPVLLFDRARTASTMVRGSERHLMIFDEAMQRRELMNQRLLNDLGRAIEQRELEVYYQPKYAIQGVVPKLSSAEALVRWRHPELGLIPPDDFIPLFEGNGQISEIDRYVWREAARQIADWREKYGVGMPMSVNLSRVDVLDPALERTLDDLVAEYGLERRLLNLEITESAYTENAEQLCDIIHRLREKGYEIEMDDFGSGYSSLNMLSSMPIDVLKMDRAFIQNIEHSPKDFRLVELILDIARNLQVPVVAEGVETEKQLAMLRDAGCALVQGYYFSKPLPAEAFERDILRQYAPVQPRGAK